MKKALLYLLSKLASYFKRIISSFVSFFHILSIRNLKFPFKIRQIFLSLFGIVLILASFALGRISAIVDHPKNPQVLSVQADPRPFLPNPTAQQTINKEFTFPFNDSKNNKVSNLKYIIESAFLQSEIFIQGQKATAVKGKTFLIINLKIQNQYEQGIKINTRDYIRLSTNGGKDWIAPDIHNDPVEVQAISTKFTRIGFPINETDKNLKLRVGEIDGPKTIIDLNL